MRHEKVVIVKGPRSGVPIIVAVHSTALGQAAGGPARGAGHNGHRQAPLTGAGRHCDDGPVGGALGRSGAH